MSKSISYVLIFSLGVMLVCLLMIKKEAWEIVEISLERDREYQLELSRKSAIIQGQGKEIQMLRQLLSRFL